jgi:hypothetical protein
VIVITEFDCSTLTELCDPLRVTVAETLTVVVVAVVDGVNSDIWTVGLAEVVRAEVEVEGNSEVGGTRLSGD